jgi:hypothetical protein
MFVGKFMGIDQYGTTYHGLVHPRKDLMERLGKQHADKIYRDFTSGGTFHVGYVIGGLWITLYKVEEVLNPVSP